LSKTSLTGVKSEKELFKRREAAWWRQIQQLDPTTPLTGESK